MADSLRDLFGTGDPDEYRKKLAAMLVQQGTDASAIRSPWQGAARLAQALTGGMMMNDLAQNQGDSVGAGINAGRIGAGLSPLGANPSAGVTQSTQPPMATSTPNNNLPVTPPMFGNRPEQPDTPTIWGDRKAVEAGLYDPPPGYTPKPPQSVPMPPVRPAPMQQPPASFNDRFVGSAPQPQPTAMQPQPPAMPTQPPAMPTQPPVMAAGREQGSRAQPTLPENVAQEYDQLTRAAMQAKLQGRLREAAVIQSKADARIAPYLVPREQYSEGTDARGNPGQRSSLTNEFKPYQQQPSSIQDVEYAQRYWQQLGFPNPNSGEAKDQQFWRDYNAKRLGGTGVNVAVSADKTGAELMAKKGVEGFETSHNEAMSATRKLPLYGQIAQAMQGFQPGATAELQYRAKSILKDLGFIGDAGVSSAEAFKSASSRLQFMAAPKGQGSFSNLERELLAPAIPTMANSPEGVVKVLGMMQRLDQYDIDVARLFRENARKNGGTPNYLEVTEEINRLPPPMTPGEIGALEQIKQGRVPAPNPQGAPPPSSGGQSTPYTREQLLEEWRRRQELRGGGKL